MTQDTTTLTSDLLTISIATHGAELCSIIDRSGREYLWQADPRYWKRHSPILFPIVGSVRDGHFTIDGRQYSMSQHGFARDSDFTPLGSTGDEAWYELTSSDTTLAAYPYKFRLQVGYRLTGETVTVIWRVTNTDDRDIYFQIGAHPAFYYPDYGSDGERGYLWFDREDSFTYLRIGDGACASLTPHSQPLDGHLLRLDTHTFDIDTFIIEGSQLTSVALLDRERRPHLTMQFDSPLLGIWSPPRKDAPFVCIEPWYGRCDREGFEGEFRDRDHVNRLAAGQTFEASYKIIIDRAKGI
ncbi:MAG TPA: aldose 1-epimerase family protein [Candidatus Avibacteroides avistercoris]|uniref:Aldose 1-epimerase family protein n=1 Tax=Candidatus Avibacteroides avistercoris TaxID=2840690 RepID=A0A9D2ZUM6_9BACT|nr:aldose 1-epimerase family protein [Candidatus Avibacteroides avistercoris]